MTKGKKIEVIDWIINQRKMKFLKKLKKKQKELLLQRANEPAKYARNVRMWVVI